MEPINVLDELSDGLGNLSPNFIQFMTGILKNLAWNYHIYMCDNHVINIILERGSIYGDT